MLQINRFKTTKLTSRIIDYDSLSESKKDVTLIAHMSYHLPVKIHNVSEKTRTQMSQIKELPTPAGQETFNLSSKALLFEK